MERLTAQEEQAMQAIWKTGEGNVKAFLENIEPPIPPYTTLASTVKNLEKKGYLQGKLLGNTYIYSATITAADYKKQFMKGFVKDYFADSYKELVSFFVKEKKLSSDELKEIVNIIEKGKSN